MFGNLDALAASVGARHAVPGADAWLDASIRLVRPPLR